MRWLWCLIVVMAVAGCGKKDFSRQSFSGTLEMTEHQLGAKAAGRVATLTVEEGDAVTAGQLIATLDRYEQSKKDLARAEALLKQGGSNQQTVEYARLAMEDQQVITPVDGVVLVKVREVGETATAGAPVVVVGDVKDQWVRIFVPEGMINHVRLGQRTAVSFDGLDRAYTGHVRTIATKGEFTPRNVQTPEERVTQGFAVKIAIDDTSLPAHAGVAADVKFEN